MLVSYCMTPPPRQPSAWAMVPIRSTLPCKTRFGNASNVSESVAGTKGTANPGGNYSVKGGERWRSTLKLQSGDAYTQEHIDLINAILDPKIELNETKNVTTSTLTAIMGREAAYSGGWVEWDQILNSKFMYGPEQLYTDASKMTFGDFRTLKPPMPSMHDVLKDPATVQVEG